MDWCTKAGEVALHESRAVRARTIADDVTALDVLMFLRAEHGAVKLDGDPQHAGHQFRALQQFAEEGDDAPKVHYVRPPDAVAHDNDVWTDCAWIAAVLPLPEGSVTVLRIEDPRNGAPGPWQPTWSTRAYGRFGAMFEREIPD
ncbi:MAG: PmoA family protein, partial [Planctomycetes bacterium]|nr:PmoA family protein [Planctomycetota bacterium]